MNSDQKSRYFQNVARCFFNQRGAPFFLSSKEIELIAQWEKMGIPFHVIREGINRSFSRFRMTPGRKGKVLSLEFCQHSVMKSFTSYKERKVGKSHKKFTEAEKGKNMNKAVKNFLDHLPPELEYLREVFIRAQRLLEKNERDEESLERIEQEVENLLCERASSGDKERVRKEVLKEYNISDSEEWERVFRIKLLKYLREKHKIPYVSPYYY